jgi:hypothetical protein
LSRDGLRQTPEDVEIEIRVVPRAKRDEITGWDDSGRLKIRVAAPPVEGAANEAVRKLVAARLGVSARQVTISRGETSRQKTLAIRGVLLGDVEKALEFGPRHGASS